MSRNGSGTYSLPAGNPVVTLEVISSTWANTTLSDIASALTDSLSRSGLGSMTAPLKHSDGAIGTPSLTYGSETTLGWYRAAAGDMRLAIGGSDTLRITSTIISYNGNNLATTASVPVGANPSATIGLSAINGAATTFLRSDGAPALSQAIVPSWTGIHNFTNFTGSGTGLALGANATTPGFFLRESGAAVDNKTWEMLAVSEQLRFRAINDANSIAGTWLTVDRTGTVIDSAIFPTDGTPAVNGFFRVGTTVASGVSGLSQFRTTTSGVAALTLHNTSTTSVLSVHSEATAGDNIFLDLRTEAAGGSQRGTIDYNRAGGLVRYNTTSDARLKINIRDSGSALAIVKAIKVRAFEWRNSEAKLSFWPVAQELYEVFPDAVSKPADESKEQWAVDTSVLIPVLIKAVQELIAARGL